MVEKIRANGGVISREPGPVAGLSIIYAFGLDPDGYTYEIVESSPAPALNHINLNVADLDRAIKFYEKVSSFLLFLSINYPGSSFAWLTA